MIFGAVVTLHDDCVRRPGARWPTRRHRSSGTACPAVTAGSQAHGWRKKLLDSGVSTVTTAKAYRHRHAGVESFIAGLREHYDATSFSSRAFRNVSLTRKLAQ